MTTRMTIGEFSRATRLSAKTLRFYHRVGLLEPAQVDPGNGYRIYAVDQIGTARLIREFRVLDMPVNLIRDVLAVPEEADRHVLIRAHLKRMEDELARTRAAVAALRSLLVPPPDLEVVHRHVPATRVLIIRATIDLVDLGGWYTETSAELDHLAAAPGLIRTGPRGGVWSTELFLDERGDAALFVPVDGTQSDVATGGPAGVSTPGRARLELLPAVDLAVAVHRGPDETIGRTYAALGEHVARQGVGGDGPTRETYLQEPDAAGHVVTEIGWPVSGRPIPPVDG